MEGQLRNAVVLFIAFCAFAACGGQDTISDQSNKRAKRHRFSQRDLKILEIVRKEKYKELLQYFNTTVMFEGYTSNKMFHKVKDRNQYLARRHPLYHYIFDGEKARKSGLLRKDVLSIREALLRDKEMQVRNDIKEYGTKYFGTEVDKVKYSITLKCKSENDCLIDQLEIFILPGRRK